MFERKGNRFLEFYVRPTVRLAAVVCLLYLGAARFFSLPDMTGEKVEAVEYGMGGGSRSDAAIPESIPLVVEKTELPAIMEFEPDELFKPQTLMYSSYAVQKGDIIGDLAASFGLNQDSLISVNGIRNTRLIQIGQVLKVPNQDGILYTVKAGDTLDAIAEKNKAEVAAIQTANELFSDTIHPGTALFIPGARLDWVNLQEINGDLFIWPTSGHLSSLYGYRLSPFTKVRQFHTGIDISAPIGTPIRAAMPGRVSAAGWNDIFGHYVMISHHSGYRTLYGHLSAIRTKTGAYVGTGERIGDVGSTGLSTGPHLHFTVYKNGVTVNPRALMK